MDGIRRRIVLVAVLAVVGAAAFAAGALLERTTSRSTADTAEAYAAALQCRDVEAMVALYGDPFTYEDPGLEMHLTTREQIHDWYWNLFLPSVRFRVASTVAGPDAAVIEWVWSGTRVWSDLEPYSIRGVSVLEVSDGLITRQVVYYDPSPFREPVRYGGDGAPTTALRHED